MSGIQIRQSQSNQTKDYEKPENQIIPKQKISKWHKTATNRYKHWETVHTKNIPENEKHAILARFARHGEQHKFRQLSSESRRSERPPTSSKNQRQPTKTKDTVLKFFFTQITDENNP